MNSWYGYAIFVAGFIASVIIRIPHDKRSQETKVSESRKGLVEKMLLSLMAVGIIVLPILSLTPVLSFADYELHPVALIIGIIATLLSLWLFHRSHSDLGKYWSVSLEIRENHSLVTAGVYNSIRHPMYSSIFLTAVGQAFLIANWIAGPATLVSFTIMFFSRLNSEEKMMLDKFGDEYEAYRRRSKRIIPGIW